MKKKTMAALILLMVMGLSGCGRKENNSAQTQTASRDYVYKMEDLDLGAGNEMANQLLRSGDTFYAYGYTWSEEGDSNIHFFRLNEDGAVDETWQIPIKEDVNISYIQLDDEGNIYCIKNEFHSVNEETLPDANEETGAEEEPEAEPGEGEDTDTEAEAEEAIEPRDTMDAPEPAEEEEYIDDYYLTKMSLSGEEFFSVKLNDIPEFKQLAEDNGYFYIGSMILDKGKGLYVGSYNSFFRFDLDGGYNGVVSENGGEDTLDGASLFTLNDGRIVAIIYEESGMSIAVADLENGVILEKYKIPGASYEYSYYAGSGYDLYLTNSYGLYGYNLGDTDKTQLMSFIDSDFDFYNIYQVMGISDKEFYALHDDSETGESVLAKFTKIPPEEVKEKKLITLAMWGSGWSIRRSVVAFNRKNENYRISILDYHSLYGTTDDYLAGISRLNTDIVSGKMPDILLIDSQLPVDSYIGKGLFEDLKPYIERDEAFDISDFMPNIIEACSVDGRLYTLVPSYYIQTVVAKTSEVGEEGGWTVSEAMELMASKPEGVQLIEGITRDACLEYCMSLSGSEFVDWESGTCSFNSDEFIQMLEFMGTLPESLDDSSYYTDEYWNNYDSMWREGKIIASFNTIGSFSEFNRIEKGTFGEDITMIGFPAAGGDGSVIMANMQLAMSSKSKNKEGVWEFLRTFLTEEYQKEVEYSFPLSVKRLDELAKEATRKPYYIDENNNKVEYDDYYYINDQEILIPPMTQQEAEEFKTRLYSFTGISRNNDDLIKIIEEEAASYFAGQKNVKDVAAIIQSRAQLYVNENS